MKDWKEYDENRFRKKQIILRVTEDELRIINKKAEVACLSRNGYLIKMAIEGAVIVQDLDNMRDFTNEINKIGVNINQIAKHINTTNNIYKSDIEEIKEKVEEIYKSVESIL